MRLNLLALVALAALAPVALAQSDADIEYALARLSRDDRRPRI